MPAKIRSSESILKIVQFQSESVIKIKVGKESCQGQNGIKLLG